MALTRAVSHYGLAIYILKKGILKQKKNYENSKLFHHAKSSKNPLKEIKILQEIITL
jgi:hypothetical protein